jgi:hypothetical protein
MGILFFTTPQQKTLSCVKIYAANCEGVSPSATIAGIATFCVDRFSLLVLEKIK